MAQPISIKWELGRDRFSRRVVMTREGQEFKIEIEPSSQRDEGERIHNLSRELLLAAGEIAKEQGR